MTSAGSRPVTLATDSDPGPVQGLDAPLVRVDVDVGAGLPTFNVVGLPETAVRESKDRVRAAISNCGYRFPEGRLTVSLAPADLPKEGGRFDLPIAVAILAASGQLKIERLEATELYGELSLGGELRAIRGILPTALHASRARNLIVIPVGNLDEAGLLRGARVYGARHLSEVCRYAEGKADLTGAYPPRHRARCRCSSTSPMYAASRVRAARSRSQPPASTACSSSARPAPARACSRARCPGSCRR